MSLRSTLFSPHTLLGRKIKEHMREFHGVSRRTFLQNAAGSAGFALTASLGMPQFAHAEKTDNPKPIPAGVSPLGIFIHHFPVQPTATPMQALTEPSQITDFKGFVGLNRIRGGGTGSGYAGELAFQADVGFMKGQYIGADGNQHEGVFGFI